MFIVYVKFGTFDLRLINALWRHPYLYDLILRWQDWVSFLDVLESPRSFHYSFGFPMHGRPTPASALIHAATMVAAGIYLLAKTYLLLNTDALTVIAFIGAFTALMGALPATAQTDIKKKYWHFLPFRN